MGSNLIGALKDAYDRGGFLGIILGVAGGLAAASVLKDLIVSQCRTVMGVTTCPDLLQLVYVGLFLIGAYLGSLLAGHLVEEAKSFMRGHRP